MSSASSPISTDRLEALAAQFGITPTTTCRWKLVGSGGLTHVIGIMLREWPSSLREYRREHHASLGSFIFFTLVVILLVALCCLVAGALVAAITVVPLATVVAFTSAERILGQWPTIVIICICLALSLRSLISGLIRLSPSDKAITILPNSTHITLTCLGLIVASLGLALALVLGSCVSSGLTGPVTDRVQRCWFVTDAVVNTLLAGCPRHLFGPLSEVEAESGPASWCVALAKAILASTALVHFNWVLKGPVVTEFDGTIETAINALNEYKKSHRYEYDGELVLVGPNIPSEHQKRAWTDKLRQYAAGERDNFRITSDYDDPLKRLLIGPVPNPATSNAPLHSHSPPQ